jgi:hypothetical protein
VKPGANVHKRDKKELEAFIQLHISFITREVSLYFSHQTSHRLLLSSHLNQKTILVNEELLREIYSSFGQVFDVSIKEHTVSAVSYFLSVMIIISLIC